MNSQVAEFQVDDWLQHVERGFSHVIGKAALSVDLVPDFIAHNAADRLFVHDHSSSIGQPSKPVARRLRSRGFLP